MASALFDSLLASRGVTTPKIAETTRLMTITFLSDVKLYMEARNPKISWHNSSGLYYEL